ncbi:MAG: hypothetical protein V3W34_20885 [Phycisphaerae bacterium]
MTAPLHFDIPQFSGDPTGERSDSHRSVDSIRTATMNRDATVRERVPRERSEADLRSTINRVMGATFFGPLLKMGRESTFVFKGTVGHGGHGEDVFGAQLDAILAERAGLATNYDLSDVLFRRFSRAAAAHAERVNQ